MEMRLTVQGGISHTIIDSVKSAIALKTPKIGRSVSMMRRASIFSREVIVALQYLKSFEVWQTYERFGLDAF